MELNIGGLIGMVQKAGDARRVERARHSQLRELMREAAKRSLEGPALYHPLPAAISFHASRAKTRVIDGSNRCISGDQVIHDPVTGRSSKASELKYPFHVTAIDPNTGKSVVRRASAPFIKGRDVMYELFLSNGSSLKATLNHYVLAFNGSWVSVKDAITFSVPIVSTCKEQSRSLQRSHREQVRCTQSPLQSRESCVSRTTQEPSGVVATCILASHGVSQPQTDPAPWLRGFCLSSGVSQSLRSKGIRARTYQQQLPPADAACVASLLPQGFCGDHLLTSSGTYLSNWTEDATHWSCRVQGFQFGCQAYRRSCDGRPRCLRDSVQDVLPSKGGVRGYIACDCDGLSDGVAGTGIDSLCSQQPHQPIEGAPLLEVGQCDEPEYRTFSKGDRWKYCYSGTCFQLHSDSFAQQRTFDEALASSEHWSISLPYHPPQFNTDTVRYYCTIDGAKKLGVEDVYDITVEEFSNYVASGVINANSGKTLAASVECAYAVQGCDPNDKYVKRNGYGLVVGLDLDHVGQLWQKLTREGEYKMIQDEHTRLWRAVRPDWQNPTKLDPYDEAYREKWRDAPPLVSPQSIVTRGIKWETSGEIPRTVQFKTGWKLLFRSSKGDAPRGEHYTFFWIDEQIKDEMFYTEGVRGCVAVNEPPKHTPKIIWSATPQDCNVQLYELRQKADQGAGGVDAFFMSILSNPFISDEEKEAFRATLSEDEEQTRFHGVYASTLARIYGIFEAQGIHGCEPFAIPTSEWSRFVSIDPGSKHCGVLFLAVDPDEKHAWVYDGFDIRGREASRIAAEIKSREGEHKFEAFVIDHKMGRQVPPGFGKNVATQLMDACRQIDLTPNQEGPFSGCFPGSSDIAAREQALLGWMAVRGSGQFAGTPRLQVFRGCLPKLEKQIRNAQIDPDTGKRLTKGMNRDQDLVTCLEYFAGFDPRYAVPKKMKPPEPVDMRANFLKRKHRNHARRTHGLRLGAGVEIG